VASVEPALFPVWIASPPFFRTLIGKCHDSLFSRVFSLTSGQELEMFLFLVSETFPLFLAPTHYKLFWPQFLVFLLSSFLSNSFNHDRRLDTFSFLLHSCGLLRSVVLVVVSFYFFLEILMPRSPFFPQIFISPRVRLSPKLDRCPVCGSPLAPHPSHPTKNSDLPLR